MTPAITIPKAFSNQIRRSPWFSPRVAVALMVSIIVAVLLTGAILVSSASSRQAAVSAPAQSAAPDSPFVMMPSSPIASRSWLLGSYTPAPPMAAVSVEIFASDCTTPKTLFNLQDADKIVCAKVTGGDPSWRILWSNANNVIVQNVALGAGTSTFTLNSGSSLGDWRVIAYEPFGGSVYAITPFTVVDAANPSADVGVSKGVISGSASAGAQVLFVIQVSNSGPSDAAAVNLTDAIPSGTSFVSFSQLSGPLFTCTNPTAGSTSGSSDCSITSLVRGDTAVFVATYDVGAVSSGTIISNTATISSTTPDPNNRNDSMTATVEVAPAPCQLSTPSNITVGADPGQAGAVVTYATPTGTGDCGQTTTGEGGEVIPPISCSPASGSFFNAGTTTVICTAQTGAGVSFQVTVDNPGALSITLNGNNPATVECGGDFNDPSASAVNGTGQSVPVEITLPQGFDPSAPAVGSYTITYTATEGQNSVSTTRTVNVSDTEAPSITVAGANPYKIQQGSCAPFVDPGVSANDGCAGPVTATSSTSGPGGATSVNTSVPGTYTVTYTATDGSHQATATRTVLIGNFPEDEVDQPASSNPPPTITMNGSDQITIECGTPFTDPGATAAVCGASVPVTTTGTVNNHTPGTYSITYTATANGATTTATRTVTVEPDNSAPVITLNGANPMVVECHTSFTDPGAVAHDACAGDFPATASGSVNPNVPGTYVITYNATDPSGHAATPVTRTVIVGDTLPPTISCQSDVVVDFNPVVNGAVVTYTAPVGTDSCSMATTTQIAGLASGSTFPLGTTINTFRATDSAGHSADCSFNVTVALTSLVGLDSVTITGSGYADSYNSSGGYPATKSSLVNILSNGTITIGGSGKVWGNVRSTRTNVNMTGSSQVTGNATAGTTVTTSGSATVLGTRTNNALAPVMTLPSVSPCSPFSPNSGITGTYTYNAGTGDLTLSGVNIATLANGNYCFHNVTIGNSSQLKVNGPVVIKLTGTLNTSGASNLNNTTQIPSNLRILSSYSGSNGVVIGNSASVYALIYSPQTGLNMSGAAPLFGTAAAKSLTIGNSGAIHYDTQLKTAWPAVWTLVFGP